jgi:hypothetical protein
MILLASRAHQSFVLAGQMTVPTKLAQADSAVVRDHLP